jgi:3-oxoacyl-[acyl-carrier-protein] synthase-3
MCSRLVPTDQPSSAILGDAATAVVVGRVAEGYGLLGRSHATDGTHFNALAVGVPGRRWYEEGRNVFYAADKDVARKLILSVADRAREATGAALADAGLAARDVDFYASHQGTSWLRRVTQAHSGLDHARSFDTFPFAASVMGVNVPLVLALAEREGALVAGDLSVVFSGGLGETWSSLVMRWGRG